MGQGESCSRRRRAASGQVQNGVEAGRSHKWVSLQGSAESFQNYGDFGQCAEFVNQCHFLGSRPLQVLAAAAAIA